MFQTKEEICKWCDDCFITNYTINDDLTVDVDSDVFLYLVPIEILPFNFGNVAGEFLLGENGLASLKGCPHTVGRDFTCGGNLITSLKYLPQIIKGTIKLFNNIELIDFTSHLKVCNNLIKTSNRIPGLTFLSYEDEVYSYDSLAYMEWNSQLDHFLHDEESHLIDDEEQGIFL